jgi:hypothetical protein
METVLILALLAEAAVAEYALLYTDHPECHSFRSWFTRTPSWPTDPRKIKELTGFLVGLLLTAFFGVAPFPVTVKWIGWLGCFCILLFIVQSAIDSIHERPLKTRVLAGGALVAIFIISFWSSARAMWIEEKSAVLTGDLLGGSSQTFADNITRMIPILQIGNDKKPSGIIMLPKSSQEIEPYFEFFRDSIVKLEPGKRGPIVSTVVRDRFGNKVVEIEKNHWRVYPPYCSDKNYTDSALEVLDNSGHVLLQLRIFPYYVLVNGEWWDNEGHGRRIVPVPEGGALVIPLGPMVQHNELLIKPVFKYPSSEHWGEFDD